MRKAACPILSCELPDLRYKPHSTYFWEHLNAHTKGDLITHIMMPLFGEEE